MFTASQIKEILSCSVHGSSQELNITALSTDSRQLGKGEGVLFFAIKTEKNDGHKYLEDLALKGVKCFVVEYVPEFEHSQDCCFFIVEKPIEALQKIATAHRARFTLPVCAITGSNGKTIVKEWLWQLIQEEFNVVRSPKSYNSQVGVPLSVWNMTENHNLAIFEAGISHPNEMERLEAIIRPQIGIFTNIGAAHQKNFKSERDKIREKLKLFKNCQTVIYPADDDKLIIEWIKTGYQANLVGWSFRKKGHLNVRRDKNLLVCQWKGLEFTVELPFTDDASVENITAALATALHLGLSPEVLTKRVPLLTQVGMRLEMLEGVNNSQLINDSYSADLSSLQIALDFLNQQLLYPRKVLILSDILEAGLADDVLYKRVAELCESKGINLLIGVGARISSSSSLFSIPCSFYPSTDDFLSQLDLSELSHSSILIKGARIFQFERITQRLQQRAHETVLEINLNAVSANLSVLRAIHPEQKIMAMVKAAAYGSGNLEIAKLLEYQRVDYLGVAYTNEGLELRKSGVQLPIMVMNPDPAHFDWLIQNKLEPEIFSLSGLKSWIRALSKVSLPNEAGMHIKIDTGMHRLGFQPNQLDELCLLLSNHPELQLKSVFSHLAAADESEFDGFTEFQLGQFLQAVDRIKKVYTRNFICHIANTAAAVRFPQARMDMVRLGIGLYGISHVPELNGKLQAAGRLKTHISQIHHISPGESVGYSRRHIAKSPQRIATIPIGYADGVPRALGNGHYQVWIKGCLAPFVGNICMDMSMVDVTAISCEEGDEVTVFGPEHPIEGMAQALQTIPYEVLTGISSRVKRVFYQE